jgi:hypothetical protein
LFWLDQCVLAEVRRFRKRRQEGEVLNMNHKGRIPTSVAFCASLVFPLVLRAGVASSSPAAPDPSYVESFEKWKAEQIDDLKQNWVPLAGLYWLKPGANTFGTDSGNAVVFPKGPAHAGEFDLDGKDVTVKLAPEAHATLAGKPLTVAKLDSDAAAHASVVEMGTLQFHAIVRGELCWAIRVRRRLLALLCSRSTDKKCGLPTCAAIHRKDFSSFLMI